MYKKIKNYFLKYFYLLSNFYSKKKLNKKFYHNHIKINVINLVANSIFSRIFFFLSIYLGFHILKKIPINFNVLYLSLFFFILYVIIKLLFFQNQKKIKKVKSFSLEKREISIIINGISSIITIVTLFLLIFLINYSFSIILLFIWLLYILLLENIDNNGRVNLKQKLFFFYCSKNILNKYVIFNLIILIYVLYFYYMEFNNKDLIILLILRYFLIYVFNYNTQIFKRKFLKI